MLTPTPPGIRGSRAREDLNGSARRRAAIAHDEVLACLDRRENAAQCQRRHGDCHGHTAQAAMFIEINIAVRRSRRKYRNRERLAPAVATSQRACCPERLEVKKGGSRQRVNGVIRTSRLSNMSEGSQRRVGRYANEFRADGRGLFNTGARSTS